MYVLRFSQVFGCADMVLPPGATMSRHGDDVAVICNESLEVFYVTCQADIWVGEIGNCTKPGQHLLLLYCRNRCIVVVSVLPLGRFLASMFSIRSCCPPFSLNPYTTLLLETHLAYPIVFFLLVFFLSSDHLSPPLAGFHL